MFYTITIDNYAIFPTQFSVIQTDTSLEFGLYLCEENINTIKKWIAKKTVFICISENGGDCTAGNYIIDEKTDDIKQLDKRDGYLDRVITIKFNKE